MFIKDKTKKYKSDIFNTQNWNYDEINDEFICPNNKRLGFKRYAYRHDKYGYKRDFKLYECDDCSECPLKNQCMNFNSKQTKNNENYNWEYFKSQINKKLSEPETKISTVKEKLMWNLFWIYEGYFGFHSDVCPRTQ